MPASATTDRYEYTLSVTRVFDEGENDFRTVVHLETTRAFANFRYELGVDETSDAGGLRYRVTGLRAPDLSLPDSGPAFFKRSYAGLKGDIEISVEGLDKRVNTFLFTVSKGHVVLKTTPPEPFVQVFTDQEKAP